MISTKVMKQADKLRLAFESAKPFKHLCIDGFFARDKAEALLRDFPRFDRELAKNEFGEYGRKAVQTRLQDISSFYADVYRYLLSREFLDAMERITGIDDLISDPSMFGGGTHDNLDGQALDVHVDFNYLESGDAHRRVNLLLYLNRGWDPAWGGQIELHSNPREPAENVVSAFNVSFNRAVLFETNEISWHGFPRICLPPEQAGNSRKCLSVYLYTKTRPAHEIAGPHSTFYVQRPLDPAITTGRTLSEEDAQQIDIAVRTRDRWIETYQKKEEALGREIQSLHAQLRAAQAQIAELRTTGALPLIGHALLRRIIDGIHYPDRWATQTLSLRLEAVHDLTRMELTVTVIQQMPEAARRFEIAIDGERTVFEFEGPGTHTLSVAARIPAGRDFVVTVLCSHFFVPMELGLGPDGRELAYLLERITIE